MTPRKLCLKQVAQARYIAKHYAAMNTPLIAFISMDDLNAELLMWVDLLIQAAMIKSRKCFMIIAKKFKNAYFRDPLFRKVDIPSAYHLRRSLFIP